MNNNFRSYVTDVAFRLTLGKTHITAMVAVRQARVWKEAANEAGGWKADIPQLMFDMALWVPAIRQLEHRGLVEIIPSNRKSPTDPQQKFYERYRFTKAGDLAWEMLKEAGLVEEVKPKRKKAAA